MSKDDPWEGCKGSEIVPYPGVSLFNLAVVLWQLVF